MFERKVKIQIRTKTLMAVFWSLLFAMADLSLALSGEIAVSVELEYGFLACRMVRHLHLSILRWWQTHTFELYGLFSLLAAEIHARLFENWQKLQKCP